MRTYEEIVQKIQANQDLLHFMTSVLLDYLPFEHAMPFLGDDAKAEDWDGRDAGDFAGYGPPTNRTSPFDPNNRAFILESMRHYAAFGWEKIQDHRSISASRTVCKMQAWLWLLGDDELVAFASEEHYAPYGAPILKAICDRYGFAIPEDNALLRMVAGDPCEPQCDHGCRVSLSR